MADDDLDDEADQPNEDGEDEDEDEDDEEGGGSGKGKGGGGKKKLIIIVGLVLFLLVGGVAGAYFTGLLNPLLGGDENPAGEDGIPQDAVFYDMEELLVSLNTAGREAAFLKIKISLELEKLEDVPKVESLLPRVIGNFQIYLRELRIEDLKGSAGMYRLREELLKRVSAAIAPIKVNDVLFKEMLVQ
jgi:flagellar FliL protein